MSRTTRVPKAPITGVYGWMLKRFSRKLLGDVPEPAEVMWHNRAVLTSVYGLGRKAQKWDRLDADLKSLAHMAVAALVGCSWCLDFGYFHAHNEGLDEVKASEVPRWRVSAVFTSLERDVMEYAEAMSETPPRVTDELSARLLDPARCAGDGGADGLGRVLEPHHPVEHGVGDRVPRVLHGLPAAVGATRGHVRAPRHERRRVRPPPQPAVHRRL